MLDKDSTIELHPSPWFEAGFYCVERAGLVLPNSILAFQVLRLEVCTTKHAFSALAASFLFSVGLTVQEEHAKRADIYFSFYR